MERVLWIRGKSGAKEKRGSNQHAAITEAIRILSDPGAHAAFRSICSVLAYMPDAPPWAEWAKFAKPLLR